MNQNILILNDVNTGNNLKQGDQTILKYLCGDGSGDILKLEGLKARVVLKNKDNTVFFSTETTVNANNEVLFLIDKILPVAKYILEIIVDDKYIFPSDNSLYLNITSSSLGSLVDEIEITSLESLKGYIKDVTEDMGAAFTQSEADELYQPKGDYAERLELDSYAKSEELDKYAERSELDSYAKSEELQGYAHVSDLEEYVKDSDLTPYATKAYVDSLDISDQLTDYATKEYVDSLDVTDQLGEYAKRTDLEEYVLDSDLQNYATKDDLNHLELTEDQVARLKGEPFRYEDFTEGQLEELKGKDGADGKDGINGVDGKDGKSFTYDDFTEEQLESLKGADGADGKDGTSIQIWKGTGDEYAQLQSTDPNTLYLIKEG